MTNTDVLKWIKKNIGTYIQKALLARPGSIYTEDWLAGIACRETRDLIARNAFSPAGNTIDPLTVCALMRGDYSQRAHETEKQYHGYGITQIDIASFPDFVHSGNWKNPYSCFLKSIDVLEGKRKYIVSHCPGIEEDPMFHQHITAAYNNGEGNQVKVIQAKQDPDTRTTGHNYSKAVFEFAEIYKALV